MPLIELAEGLFSVFASDLCLYLCGMLFFCFACMTINRVMRG